MLGKIVAGAVVAAGVATAAPAIVAPGWTNLGHDTYSIQHTGTIYDNTNGDRVYNNAWAQPGQHLGALAHVAGRYGDSIKITSDAKRTGNVSAYPNVRTGEFFSDRDYKSGLPIKLTNLHNYSVRTGCSGNVDHAYQEWLCDSDTYFHPSFATANQHATFELVVVTRASYPAQNSMEAHEGRRVWVGGQEYYEQEWLTGSGHNTWPLMLFFKAHETSSGFTIPLFRFVYRAYAWHYVSRNAVMGSTAFGSEVWSGAKNLNMWMKVLPKG